MSNFERPEMHPEQPENIIDLIREYEHHGVVKSEAWNMGLGAGVHEKGRMSSVEKRMNDAKEAMTALRGKLEARGVAFDRSGQIDLGQSSEDVRSAVEEYNEALKHKEA